MNKAVVDSEAVTVRSVVLIGLPGSGKSTIAKVLHEQLDWTWVDVDAEIERICKRSITELIRVEGEQRFRALEAELLKVALEQQTQVISVGGGAILRGENRDLIRSLGTAVHLAVSPSVAANRVTNQEVLNQEARLSQGEQQAAVVRPLVFPEGPGSISIAGAESRIATLLSERDEHYNSASIRMWTDYATPIDVALSVADLVQLSKPEGSILVRIPVSQAGHLIAHEIHIGSKLLESLPAIIDRECSDAETVALVIDRNVNLQWGEHIRAGLKGSKRKFVFLEIPSGESAKNFADLEGYLTQMAEAGMTRQDLVVGIGGGVAGDVSGFLAALFMRGIPHFQIPTTVVAQVDSAMGGKNGVNLERGKNLVGSFHLPKRVISDVDLLMTLPEREYLSGLAEVVKYGAIFSESFFEWLERECEKLQVRDTAVLSRMVEQSSLFKTRVVTQDLHERLGLRALLNFGHTIGHALEKLAGYGQLLHGEAVAIGMIEAVRIGSAVSVTPETEFARLALLLRNLGLPTDVPAELRPWDEARTRIPAGRPTVEAVVASENAELRVESPERGLSERWESALRADKKRSGGRLHFILLEKIGRAKVVPIELGEVLRCLATVR